MSEYKRLTKKTDDFYTIDEKVSTDYIPCMVCEFEECEEAGICDLGIVIDRLAQYEDIGSPEEFAELAKAKVKECFYCKDGVYYDVLGSPCKYNHCPMCGRGLKQIGGNQDG